MLPSALILVHPNHNRRYRLTRDASDVGIGDILSQLDDKPTLSTPTLKELLLMHHRLNDAEMDYNTQEKELLAIVWATDKFRPYLYGV
jgi:DNA-binding IscR family transcriptional regulator